MLAETALIIDAHSRDQLAGLLEHKYGYAKDRAEKELDEFLKVLKP